MKLKCDAHNRRVLSGRSSWLHRTGDMSVCDSKTATIRDEVFKIAANGTGIQPVYAKQKS
jgi:hypothetical protein